MTVELVARLLDDPELWLARTTGGELVELLLLPPSVDDIEEALFRGAVVPRWRAVAALADARLPRLAAEPLRVDGRNAFVLAHAPFVAVDALADLARASGGLAFPLVLAAARDLAGALLALHGAGLAGIGALGAGVDGTFRVVTLDDDDDEAEPARDVAALGRVLAVLACGTEQVRPDLPAPFVSLLAWMVTAAPSAAVVEDALDDDELAWARWTREQVVAELRALIPALDSIR